MHRLITPHPEASSEIDEPLEVVWGSPGRITVVDGSATDTSGVTTATLAYAYEGWPSRLGLVRGIRFQWLTRAPGAPTTYDTVEEFSGPLVPLAGPGRPTDHTGQGRP